MGSRKSSGSTAAPLLQLTNLSVFLPDGRKVLGDVSLSLHRRRIGLIGKNGGGKTTLLRVLAGEQLPRLAGTREGACTVGFLRQASHSPIGESVAAAMGIAAKREALRRLSDGEGSPELFATIGDDWDIEARAERALADVGLPPQFLDRIDTSLSGGEGTRVRLAALLLATPDLLLLDEPSNHLDAAGREALLEFMERWSKGLIIASHDRTLLEHMDEIWELREGKLFVYGGNYTFYRAQRNVEEEAACQQLEAARLEMKRAEAQANEARERQAKRSARGAKSAPKQGLPTIVLGMMKRRAEETTAKMSGAHERTVEQAKERLAQARTRVSQDESLKIDAGAVTIPKDKLMLAFEDLNITLPGAAEPLWSKGLNTTVHGPARIALKGANGTGKSTLLRLLTGISEGVVRGTLRWGTTSRVYCDQTLAFLRDEMTVLENFQEWTPRLAEAERRICLGRSLFPGDSVFKRAGDLSGGERMRLAIACLLAGEVAPQVLLLDEPTNHLDLASLEQLEASLRFYRGVLIVVSHDEIFLEALEITQTWELGRDGLFVF